MNDLLSGSFELPHRAPSRGGDVEMGMHPSGMDLDQFFTKIDDIDKQIEKINGFLKKLQDSNAETKSVTKADGMKAIKQRMEKDVDEVRKIALQVKTKIEELDRENLTNRGKPGCGAGTAIDRTRTARTVAVKKKLKDKMTDFQNLRNNIRQEYRDVVARRLFTVTGEQPDDDAVDLVIETGESEQIFQKAIQEQGRGQILDTLNEIQERHDSVIDLEKKLLDLQQIFMDIAVLVEAQGEILNNIESQVSSAVDHVHAGNKALHKAKKMQRKSRKWMCIAILIFLMIVIIMLVGVIRPWTSTRGA